MVHVKLMPIICTLFIVTLTAFLFVEPGGPWQIVFYVVFVIGGTAAVVRQRNDLITYAPARLWMVWVPLAYCFVIALTLTQHTPEHAIKVARNSLTTIAFVALCVMVFAQRSEHVRKILTTMAIAGLVGSLASIAVHVVSGQSLRLMPLGQASHPISGASVYGVLGLVAAHLYLTREHRGRPLLLVASLSVFTLILLSRSRGELLAFAIASAAALVIPHGRQASARRPWPLIAGLTATPLALGFVFVPDYVLQLMEHGAGWRPETWRYIITQVKVAPWFGHGFVEQLDFWVANNERIAHPHNLVLSTLYYSGVFGVALLLMLAAALMIAVRRQWGTATGHLSACLLIHVCLSTLTDGGRLVTGASEFLYYFWLPVCIIVGRALSTGAWGFRPAGTHPGALASH